MTCPICKTKLEKQTVNGENMWQCPTCGMCGNLSVWNVLRCYECAVKKVYGKLDETYSLLKDCDHSARDATCSFKMRNS